MARRVLHLFEHQPDSVLRAGPQALVRDVARQVAAEVCRDFGLDLEVQR